MRTLIWNPREQRPRLLWRLIGQALILGTLGFLLLLPLWSLLLAPGVLAGIPRPLDLDTLVLLYATGVALVATVLSVWIAGRVLDRRPFADFGFHFSRAWWADLLFGLALGALLMAGVFGVELAAGWISVVGLFHTGSPAQPFFVGILVPLALFVCVGIYEELLARGYLLRNLAEGLHLPGLGLRRAYLLAWVVSSVLFGLAHATNPNASVISTLNLVAAGLFLGLGYLLTGELAIPIGLHITWNFFQGNVFGFPVSGTRVAEATVVAIDQHGPDLWTGGAFGPEAGLLGLAAMLVGSFLILLWVRRERRTQPWTSSFRTRR